MYKFIFYVQTKQADTYFTIKFTSSSIHSLFIQLTFCKESIVPKLNTINVK